MSFIYLASPYTPVNGESIEDRVRMVTEATAELMKRGNNVFSPIVHSHHVANYLPEEYRLDHEFWMKQDLAVLAKADSLWVYKMDGWDRSKGVGQEIAFARNMCKPIYFISKEFIDGDMYAWKTYSSQLSDTGDAIRIGVGVPNEMVQS